MLTFQGSWKNEYEAKGNEVALLGLEASVCSIMPNSLQHHGLWPAMLLCPWDSLGKNTGVGCHFLLQTSECSSIPQGLYFVERPHTVWLKSLSINLRILL